MTVKEGQIWTEKGFDKASYEVITITKNGVTAHKRVSDGKGGLKTSKVNVMGCSLKTFLMYLTLTKG